MLQGNVYAALESGAVVGDCRAIYLSQSFPDFPTDPVLIAATLLAMRDGRNQYSPIIDIAERRAAIADEVEALYGVRCDVGQYNFVTAGGNTCKSPEQAPASTKKCRQWTTWSGPARYLGMSYGSIRQ